VYGRARKAKPEVAALRTSTLVSGLPGDPKRLEVLPEALDFGQLCVGNVYRLKLVIANRGKSLARFRLGAKWSMGRPLDVGESSGCTVFVDHRPPGEVAAGIRKAISVVLTATVATDINEVVEVITERQTFTLPLTAHVVPPALHSAALLGRGVTVSRASRPPVPAAAPEPRRVDVTSASVGTGSEAKTSAPVTATDELYLPPMPDAPEDEARREDADAERRMLEAFREGDRRKKK
jgi:hypothetical protein